MSDRVTAKRLLAETAAKLNRGAWQISQKTVVPLEEDTRKGNLLCLIAQTAAEMALLRCRIDRYFAAGQSEREEMESVSEMAGLANMDSDAAMYVYMNGWGDTSDSHVADLTSARIAFWAAKHDGERIRRDEMIAECKRIAESLRTEQRRYGYILPRREDTDFHFRLAREPVYA